MSTIALPAFSNSTFFPRSLSRAITDNMHTEQWGDRNVATSISLDETRRETLEAIRDIRIEAAQEGWDGYGAVPVYDETVSQAVTLLQMLPTRLPAPEVSASPLGEISFHWSKGKRRIVSVAVSSRGRLTYATLVGESRFFGSEAMTDELPKTIVLALQKVLGAGSD